MLIYTERQKHIPMTSQFAERFNGKLATEEDNVFELQYINQGR